MTGYAFHSKARADLEEIWDFIAADSENEVTE
jgi:plasmid stabilization system protein ParE